MAGCNCKAVNGWDFSRDGLYALAVNSGVDWRSGSDILTLTCGACGTPTRLYVEVDTDPSIVSVTEIEFEVGDRVKITGPGLGDGDYQGETGAVIEADWAYDYYQVETGQGVAQVRACDMQKEAE